LKGPKIFRTNSRFALYRGALYRDSTVIQKIVVNQGWEIKFLKKPHKFIKRSQSLFLKTKILKKTTRVVEIPHTSIPVVD
jgi:hypothetical protein